MVQDFEVDRQRVLVAVLGGTFVALIWIWLISFLASGRFVDFLGICWFPGFVMVFMIVRMTIRVQEFQEFEIYRGRFDVEVVSEQIEHYLLAQEMNLETTVQEILDFMIYRFQMDDKIAIIVRGPSWRGISLLKIRRGMLDEDDVRVIVALAQSNLI